MWVDTARASVRRGVPVSAWDWLRRKEPELPLDWVVPASKSHHPCSGCSPEGRDYVSLTPRAGAVLASPFPAQLGTWLHAEPPGPLVRGRQPGHSPGWSQTLAAKGPEEAGTWAWEVLLSTGGRGPGPKRVGPTGKGGAGPPARGGASDSLGEQGAGGQAGVCNEGPHADGTASGPRLSSSEPVFPSGKWPR